jgi:hypothetical protein
LCPDSSAGDGDCRCRSARGTSCDPGRPVPNPIYEDPSGTGRVRDPSLVTLVSIVGVPWQDLATDSTVMDPVDLIYRQSSEIDWDLVLGDPSAGVPPADALMQESSEPRLGNPHPIVGIAPAPAESPAFSNPINGHEWLPVNLEDLQYVCLFDLATPRDCNELGISSCDCFDSTTDLTAVKLRKKPICQGPDGYSSIQRYAKAYPGLRHLELVRALEGQGLAASICPKVLAGVEPTDGVYGYNPAFAAVLERLRGVLE